MWRPHQVMGPPVLSPKAVKNLHQPTLYPTHPTPNPTSSHIHSLVDKHPFKPNLSRPPPIPLTDEPSSLHPLSHPLIQHHHPSHHSTSSTPSTMLSHLPTTITSWTRRKNIPSHSPAPTATWKSLISWKAMALYPHQLRSKPLPVINQSNPSNKPTKSPPPQPPHPTAQATNAAVTNAARHWMGMASPAHRESPMNNYPSHHSPLFPSSATMNRQHPTPSPSLTATPLPTHHPSIQFLSPLIPTPQTILSPSSTPPAMKLQ